MLHVHLVSDSTGETVHQAARAAIAQFPNTEVTEHIWTLVRTEDHVDLLSKSLEKHGGLLLLSVVNPVIRKSVERACVKYAVPHLSILDPVVNLIGMVLGTTANQQPGAQHRLDEAYFKRSGRNCQDAWREDVGGRKKIRNSGDHRLLVFSRRRNW